VSCYFFETTALSKLFVREAGTEALIHLMSNTEDNGKLISAVSPLEVYAAIKRRERAGDIPADQAAEALDILRMESARMVQQPLNPAVLEAARQLIDRIPALRSGDALQLASAVVAREMFHGMEITFVSADQRLLAAAASEGFPTLNPVDEAA